MAILPTLLNVGIIDNMQATLITDHKEVFSNGDSLHMVIWRVPKPVPPCGHDFKYRLAYVAGGQRVIGFDNERGKGDHSHIEASERPYVWSGVDQLVEDFIVEVEKWKSGH